MASLLHRDIEYNKMMYIYLLVAGFIVSFVINIIYLYYPDGINKNPNPKHYRNNKIKKYHNHEFECKNTYSSIMTRLISVYIVYCVLLFSIIHLFLDTKDHKERFIGYATIVFFFVIVITDLIMKITQHKQHILVFKKGDISWYFNVLTPVLVIFLAPAIFLFRNIALNKIPFGEKVIFNNKRVDVIFESILHICMMCFTILIGYIYYKLIQSFNYNLTDENLCNFYS